MMAVMEGVECHCGISIGSSPVVGKMHRLQDFVSGRSPCHLHLFVERTYSKTVSYFKNSVCELKMGILIEPIEGRWARLGLRIAHAPAAATPDIERLFIDTCGLLPHKPHMLPGLVTWIALYGNFIARHRLRRLVQACVSPEAKAAAGLIAELAIAVGGPQDLAMTIESCLPIKPGKPLAVAHRSDQAMMKMSEAYAADLSVKWGLWTAECEADPRYVMPVQWILTRNPGMRERVVRKGDLRSTILETLRHDTGGVADSELALARLSGATRAAVHSAVYSLVQEGAVEVAPHERHKRKVVIRLHSPA